MKIAAALGKLQHRVQDLDVKEERKTMRKGGEERGREREEKVLMRMCT